MRLLILTFFITTFLAAETSAQNKAVQPWVVYPGREGPGKGKHIVLISGDEEYRSEEALPMLARILATHHGFKCTVLFAVDPKTGVIDPECQTNIPGLEQLQSADLMVLFTRFRELPTRKQTNRWWLCAHPPMPFNIKEISKVRMQNTALTAK